MQIIEKRHCHGAMEQGWH